MTYQRNRQPAEENLTRAEMIDKYFQPAVTGWFTDGSCVPNPGPGGWGVVHLSNSKPLSELYGSSSRTTNQRMELEAIHQALEAIRDSGDTDTTVYSDSQYAIGCLTVWGSGWEKQGWKRKGGAIKNLDIIKSAYRTFGLMPDVKLDWVKAHSGNYGNEFADCLSTAWSRPDL